MDDARDEQLEQMRRSLQLRPDEVRMNDLFPVFVPDAFFQFGNWPGPYERLRIQGLDLTWAIERPAQTMLYVTPQLEQHWNSKGLDWRGIALANVRQKSERRPWTHEFHREAGGLYAVAMMHEDGYGPSRLLLRELFEGLFPGGYRIALPEMSVGYAMSAALPPDEEAKMQDLVQQNFVTGTRPLVPGIFPSEELMRAR